MAASFDRWEIVAEVIDSWIALHPKAWNEFVAAMNERRASLVDKEYATTTTESGLGRLLVSFPPPEKRKNRKGKVVWDDLRAMIEKVVPEFNQQGDKPKEVRAEFARKFHDFRLAEKV